MGADEARVVVLVFVSEGVKILLDIRVPKCKCCALGVQNDELSIPNQDPGINLYLGVGFFGLPQETFDAVDLFAELRYSTACSSCKLMLTQGNFANEVAIAAALREDKES